jgi:hypothetical protein
MYGIDILGDLTPEQVEEKEALMKTYCQKLGLAETIEKLP